MFLLSFSFLPPALLNDNFGYDTKLIDGVPHWSPRGADTWSPFIDDISDYYCTESYISANDNQNTKINVKVPYNTCIVIFSILFDIRHVTNLSVPDGTELLLSGKFENGYSSGLAYYIYKINGKTGKSVEFDYSLQGSYNGSLINYAVIPSKVSSISEVTSFLPKKNYIVLSSVDTRATSQLSLGYDVIQRLNCWYRGSLGYLRSNIILLKALNGGTPPKVGGTYTYEYRLIALD